MPATDSDEGDDEDELFCEEQIQAPPAGNSLDEALRPYVIGMKLVRGEELQPAFMRNIQSKRLNKNKISLMIYGVMQQFSIVVRAPWTGAGMDPWIKELMASKQWEQMTSLQQKEFLESTGKYFVINGNHRTLAAVEIVTLDHLNANWSALVYAANLPYALAIKLSERVTAAEHDTEMKSTCVEQLTQLAERSAAMDLLHSRKKKYSVAELRVATGLQYPSQPPRQTVQVFLGIAPRVTVEGNVVPGLLDLMTCLDALDLDALRVESVRLSSIGA